MADLIHTARQGAVAVLHLANPPVNALSSAMRVALHGEVVRVRDDPGVSAIVIAGEGRCFSGGADIGEFQRSADAGLGEGVDLNDLSALFDACSKPVVVAIHGVAFGGGLEIALGAHARVAASGALLGLPEVKLGVLPGAGGTQRLPRVIGMEAAAAMILSGEPVSAAKAQALGLVDVVADDLIPAACAHARALAGKPLRRARDRTLPPFTPETAAALQHARSAMPNARAHAYNGDQIVACLQAAVQLPFDDGMAFERARFLQCNASPQAAALQHVFFAQREAAKVPGLPRGTAERAMRKVGVVGAGTMGRGIAMCLARAGCEVRLVDQSADEAQAAVAAIGQHLARRSAAGKLDPAQTSAELERITALHDEAGLADCDLVIEAVFEDLALKQALMARLGALCQPGAILASNTSTLDLQAIASASGRVSDVIGLHFFSPAQAMRLLEVVPLSDTAPDVLATAMALARRMDKVAVVSRPTPGYIGNRMWADYSDTVETLLLGGVRPAAIDRALEAHGMAMGPFRTMDLVGLDTVARIAVAAQVAGHAGADHRLVPRTLATAGLHGQKSGAGFYRHGPGATERDDTDAVALIAALATSRGVTPLPPLSDATIALRCLDALVASGRALVRDGVAARASDVDMVWVFGYGYPAERGGPLFDADHR